MNDIHGYDAAALAGYRTRQLVLSGEESTSAEREAVSSILECLGRADASASERLLSLLRRDLRRRAIRRLTCSAPDRCLNPADLVQAAWMELVGSRPRPWRDRVHFVALAARAVRSVLVDRLSGLLVPFGDRYVDLAALDGAIERLSAFDPVMARAAELSVFAEVSAEQSAVMLGMPWHSFDRHWTTAHGWLCAELDRG